MGSGKGSSKLFWIIPLGCLGGVFLMCGGCVLFPLLAVYSAVGSSEVFQESLEQVQNDPRVVEELGSPIKMGWQFSGNFNTSDGEGNADFNYAVNGSKRSGNVEVEATSTDGKWTYHKLIVTANGKKIDLASAEGIVVEPSEVEEPVNAEGGIQLDDPTDGDNSTKDATDSGDADGTATEASKSETAEPETTEPETSDTGKADPDAEKG